MGALSKIQTMWEWCFIPHPESNKYLKWGHPLFSFIFGAVSSTIPIIKLIEFIEKRDPSLKTSFPKWVDKKVTWAMAIYLCTMILSRVKFFGPVALYDFMWACNISILLMVIGMKKKSHLMISSSMILIAVDQILWYIDIFGYLLFKKFYIGVAAFLKWPDTALIKKITTTHHLWFIPLALSILKTSKNLTIQSYFCSCVLSSILLVLGRVLAPKYIKITEKESQYANLNLAWELWKDVKLPFLSNKDRHFLIHAFGNLSIWNGGNFIFFLLLKGLLKIINK